MADEVLGAMQGAKGLVKTNVNECGNAGWVTFTTQTILRGLATSNWTGRSHSLGIADGAATLIANAVDLPWHPAISRVRANSVAPDMQQAGLIRADMLSLQRWSIAVGSDQGCGGLEYEVGITQVRNRDTLDEDFQAIIG